VAVKRARPAAFPGPTPEEFEALLARLDPDRDRAGERYEEIRRKLARLFEWRGCDFPEELVDETINRVARRLAEGVEIQTPDPYAFFCGVAFLVYKESWRKTVRERQAVETGDWPTHTPPASLAADDAESRRLECLRHCLDALPRDQRELLLRYHQEDDHIRSRKALCQEMGAGTLNALRIRVHRLRRRVEDCVRGRLAE
jgi:DNA-directed RNA polymerase specialized sigma24 family protein